MATFASPVVHIWHNSDNIVSFWSCFTAVWSSLHVPCPRTQRQPTVKGSVSTTRSGFGGKGRRFAPVLIKHPGLLFDLYSLFHGGETGLRPLPHDEPIGARSRDTWPGSVWEEWVSAFYRFPKGTSRQKKKKKSFCFVLDVDKTARDASAWDYSGIFLWWNGNRKQWKHESNQTCCSVLYWIQSKWGFNLKCSFAVYRFRAIFRRKQSKERLLLADCNLLWKICYCCANIFPQNLLHCKRSSEIGQTFLKLVYFPLIWFDK